MFVGTKALSLIAICLEFPSFTPQEVFVRNEHLLDHLEFISVDSRHITHLLKYHIVSNPILVVLYHSLLCYFSILFIIEWVISFVFLFLLRSTELHV
jgi:hypothetical protein